MKHYNIPIFVPHKGCPYDCVFCNQKHITGTNDEVNEEYIENTVKEYLKTLPKHDRNIEIAFFGGSFTGIDYFVQRRFLNIAYKFVKSGDVDGIRLSTRPDYIDEKILSQLDEFGVTTIELGVQSLDDEVLKKSNRGHDSECVFRAVELIRGYNFSLGLQMMTGLPGDTFEKSVATAKKIIELKPDFVRIYPTLVIKDTYLEIMYKNGEYKPQSVDSAIVLCAELLKMFRREQIEVIRIALQTTDEISPGGSFVAGPFDAGFREKVEASIYFDKLSELCKNTNVAEIVVMVNTKEISKAIGQKRCNIIKLKELYNVNVKILGDANVNKGDVLKV